PAFTHGAVKVGVALVAPASATDGPLVCIQEKRRVSLSGSLLVVASNATDEFSFTVWSVPAFAVGWLFTLVISTVTRSTTLSEVNPGAASSSGYPSSTRSSKTSVATTPGAPFPPTRGAVNAGE